MDGLRYSSLGLHIIDTQGVHVPLLLGIDTMKDKRAVLDVENGEFRSPNGESVELNRATGGHLIYDPLADLEPNYVHEEECCCTSCGHGCDASRDQKCETGK